MEPAETPAANYPWLRNDWMPKRPDESPAGSWIYLWKDRGTGKQKEAIADRPEELLEKVNQIPGGWICPPHQEVCVPPGEVFSAGEGRMASRGGSWLILALGAAALFYLWKTTGEIPIFVLVLYVIFGVMPALDAFLSRFLVKEPAPGSLGAKANVRFLRWLDLTKTKAAIVAAVLLVPVFLLQMNARPLPDEGRPEVADETRGINASVERIALDPRAVLERGEWWRILTGSLAHGHLMHIYFNATTLITVGGFVVAFRGMHRFFLILMLSMLGGALASIYLPPAGPSVGISGAICGLLGYLLMYSRSQRAGFPTFLAGRLWVGTISLALLGLLLVAILDNAAHAGGFLVGAGYATLENRGGREVDRESGPMTQAFGLASMAVFGVGLGLAITKLLVP